MCLIKRAGHWENDDQLRQDKVEKRSGKKTGAIKKSDVPGMPGGARGGGGGGVGDLDRII